MVIKRLFVVSAIILFSILTLKPLVSKGFFPMHDDAQIARVVTMGRALSHGQFPVRMVGDLGYGYGYPLFNFYGPLPYYVGGTFYVLGVSGLVATKLMIGIGIVLCGIGMFMLASSFFGMYGGLLSSMLYMFLPYRAVQLYVRGAVGEIWASACIPFIVYGLSLLWKKQTKKGIYIGGLGVAGIILSHTVFGYITIGLVAFLGILCFVLFLCKRIKKDVIMGVGFTILIGLGISAFFWLPAFGEMKYTNVSSVIGTTADYHKHFVCLPQLWDSPWGFGGSAEGCIDGMSFKIGKVHILLFILAWIVFLLRKKEKKISWMMGISLGLVLLGILGMTAWSAPLWDIIPYSSFVQYPWRLLSFVGCFMAFASGYLLYGLNTKKAIVGLGACICMLLYINLKLFTPQYLYERPLDSYESQEELQYRASRVSDEYLPTGIPKPQTANERITTRLTSHEGFSVVVHKETETQGIYTVTRETSGNVRFSMAYFPGWEFLINGKKVIPDIVDGMPSVILSKGISEVNVRFSNTPIRTLANGITIVTCLGIIMFLCKKNPQ